MPTIESSLRGKAHLRENASRPVSRVLFPPSPRLRRVTTIPLDRTLLRGSRDQPEHNPRTDLSLARRVLLFGLAPGGACRAAFLTVGAVGSYPTVSALPVSRIESGTIGGLFSVALSLRSLSAGVTRRRIRVEPGLSSNACAPAAVRPTGVRYVAKRRCLRQLMRYGDEERARLVVGCAGDVGGAEAALKGDERGLG